MANKLYKFGLYTNMIAFNYYSVRTYNKQLQWFLNYNYNLNTLRLNNSYYDNNYVRTKVLLNINDHLVKNNLDLFMYPNYCMYYMNQDNTMYGAIRDDFVKRCDELSIKLIDNDL